MVKRLRVLVIAEVAGHTFRSQTGELPDRRARVACAALRRRMRPKQGEAVLVLSHRPQAHLPTLDAMTLLALGAHLATMNIGVAIGAVRANLSENQACVTLPALNLFVQTTQWVARLVVVKLRNAADGLPTRKRVAVLAGDCQRAVRAARLTALNRARSPLR